MSCKLILYLNYSKLRVVKDAAIVERCFSSFDATFANLSDETLAQVDKYQFSKCLNCMLNAAAKFDDKDYIVVIVKIVCRVVKSPTIIMKLYGMEMLHNFLAFANRCDGSLLRSNFSFRINW